MEKTICDLLLFHSTTKENLKGIMKEGIKPGMKGGWCDLWIKRLEIDLENKEMIKGIQEYKEECKHFIFLSPSFHALESEMPKGSDTILVVCIPKEIAYIPSRKLDRYITFEEWETTRDLKEKFEEQQIIVKETILPKYIIACLDVEGEKEWDGQGEYRFRINKNCEYIMVV